MPETYILRYYLLEPGGGASSPAINVADVCLDVIPQHAEDRKQVTMKHIVCIYYFPTLLLCATLGAISPSFSKDQLMPWTRTYIIVAAKHLLMSISKCPETSPPCCIFLRTGVASTFSSRSRFYQLNICIKILSRHIFCKPP